MTKAILKIGSVVAAISVIVGGLFAVDSRYVSAADFKKQIITVKDDIQDLRRARLEDEVFKLELIPPAKRTQTDKALLDRYKRQIREIETKREER